MSLTDDAPNYCNWIAGLCAPHVVAPLLEVGIGHGSFAERFARFAEVATAESSDLPSEHLFGSAVMINVLECVDDEQMLLREILERLEPGGRLCIWAPTYEFLFSPFDAKLGRFRRYRKRHLEAAVRLAGYEVVEGRHMNLPGWLGWLILCRLLRRELTPQTAATLDAWVVPAVRWFETRVRVPIALSVFLVARKPERTTVTN